MTTVHNFFMKMCFSKAGTCGWSVAVATDLPTRPWYIHMWFIHTSDSMDYRNVYVADDVSVHHYISLEQASSIG